MLILLVPACFFGGVFPVVGGLLIWFFYVPFLESSRLQATIGKKLLGIQVRNEAGERITFRAALVRAVMKLISSALGCVPHLLALFTAKKQAFHDLVAETVVVYGRENVPVVDAWVEMVKQVFSAGPAGKFADLERLQALYDRGTLSQQEFEKEKQKILDQYR